MARDKVLRSTRLRRPVRVQDSGGLTESILADIDATLVGPLDTRVTILEALVATLAGAQVHTADVDLPPLTGGSFTITDVFEPGQIGAPVIIVQGADPLHLDEAEFCIVRFVAQVVSASSLRVVWNASTMPTRRVRIHYMIGTLQE
jgi:hypothetical protein